MPWIQALLEVTQSRCETAEDALLEAGAISVTYRDAEDNPVLEPAPGETPLWENVILMGLFEAGADTQRISQHIAEKLGTDVPVKIEQLEDKDWIRAWMDDYHPMQFGKRLWICPNHLTPPQPQAVNLMLDPGLAFGTGTHPTTALCMEWLDSADVNARTVLDYGSGSGVLAIAALLLGASHCDATDIDPQALEATCNNAVTNGVMGRLSVLEIGELNTQQYDIVLANILAGPLTELAPRLASYTRVGGQIVLSGILATQADDILRSYSPWFDMQPVAEREEWIRITGTRRHDAD